MADHTSREEVSLLLASQRLFYDLRADDYDNVAKPDRAGGSMIPAELVRALIDEFRPTGNVLELACGPGIFTGEIARYASSVTAVDASARMLQIARSRVPASNVAFIHADIFDWQPEVRYDAVFFGAWLSHVPLRKFDEFWGLVSSCLKEGGRVAFEDEDDRAADLEFERPSTAMGAVRRRLADGREFDIVKVFWRPEALESRLRALGWNVSVRSVGEINLFGVGGRGST